MKKTILLIFAAFSLLSVNAQNFAKFIGKPGPEELHTIIYTIDSSYVIAGFEADAITGDTNLFISKYDGAGNFLWANSLATVSADAGEGIGLVELADSSLVISGSTNAESTYGRAFIARISKTGAILWQKVHGCDGINPGVVGSDYRSLELLPNGNLLVAGIAGCEFGDQDGMYRVYDSLGAVVQGYHFGFSGIDEFTDAQMVKDSGMVFSGKTDADSLYPQSGWLVKTDTFGIREWSRTYRSANNIIDFKSFVQMPDSGYMVVGSHGPDINPNADVLIVRVSKTGQVKWSKIYHILVGNETVSSIQALDSNRFSLGGTTDDNSGGTSLFSMVVDSTGLVILTAIEDNPSSPLVNEPDAEKSYSINVLNEVMLAGTWTNQNDGDQDIFFSIKDTLTAFCYGTSPVVLNVGVTDSLIVPDTNQVANDASLALINYTAFNWTKDTIQCFCGPGPGLQDTVRMCTTTSALLNIQGGIVEWTPNQFITCTDCNSPTVFPPTSMWYYVAVDTGTQCELYDSVYVEVMPLPQPDLGPDSMVCSDAGMILDPGAFVSYTWQDTTFDPTFTIDGNSATGWYFVDVVGPNGCSNRDSVFVTIIQTPFIDLGPDGGICENDPVTFDASSVPGPYLWQDGSTGPTFTTDTSGVFWLELDNNGCKFRDTVILIDLPTPLPNLGPDTVVCEGETVFISPGGGFTSYVWQDAQQGQNYAVSGIPDGSTNLYYVDVTNASGCTARDSIYVTGSSIPTVEFDTSEYQLCPNFDLFLIPSYSAVYDSIVWNTGETTEVIQATQQQVYIVTIWNNGCSAVDSTLVFEVPFPSVELGPDTAICNGDITGFFPVANTLVTWSTGHVGPFIYLSNPGIYWAGVSNDCGSDRDTIIIQDLGCDCNVWVPNIFTPNFDGSNDVFGANVECALTIYKMTVFNRWGDIVHVSSSQDATWNGNIDGTPAPEGVYFYTLYAESLSSKENLSGYISLYR